MSLEEDIRAEVARQVTPLREALEAMGTQMQAARAAAAAGPDPNAWPPTGWFQPRGEGGPRPPRSAAEDDALAAHMERQAAERNRIKHAAIQARIARIEQHAAARGAWRHSQGAKP